MKKIPITGLDITGLTLKPLKGKRPELTNIDPRLVVSNLAFQREIMKRQRASIVQMIENFDYDRIDPVKLAWTEDGLEVIDGQCRLIAAASRPDVTEIPAIIVDAPKIEERAGLFVGVNRDRIPVTPNQIYRAAVVAMDPVAIEVDVVAKAAGVRILATSPPFGTSFEIGDTTALGSIRPLIKRRGPDLATQILKALVQAGLAPIPAALIRAGEAICTESEYAAEFGPEQLTAVLRALGSGAQSEVKALAAAKCLPLWRAWVAVLFKHRKAKPKAEPVRPAQPEAVLPAAPPPARRIIDRRPVGPVYLGEPEPGRSALDQRQGVR